MAIIRTTEKTKTILDAVEQTPTNVAEKIQFTKKTGFLRSAIAELRLVQWPSWNYTLSWSLIVLLFTLILTTFVGGVDQVFKSASQYATCTSKAYKGTGGSNYNQCLREFGQNLISFK